MSQVEFWGPSIFLRLFGPQFYLSLIVPQFCRLKFWGHQSKAQKSNHFKPTIVIIESHRLLFLQLKLLRLLRLLLQCLCMPLPCGILLERAPPPYRIGAPDRRQFLGTIKLQPSRSTQKLTFFGIFWFFLKHAKKMLSFGWTLRIAIL